MLETDRFFDQLLMYAGIATHYYPMNEQMDRPQEKGIELWLSLEAYDLAVHKNYDVIVLFAGDSDFVPLVRKVHSLGTRVMVLAWDLESESDDGRVFVTRTSAQLMHESTYPLLVCDEIDKQKDTQSWLIDNLFAGGPRDN